MNNLIPLEFKNQRIITTKVLAEEFGATEKNINDNFSNNKERFIEGKHYYKLEGQALKEFKSSLPDIIGEPFKFAPKLILWTEKGAARHAKILDTDEAWDVYEELEETYFRVKNEENILDTSELSPELQMFNKMLQAVAKSELEQKKIKQQLNEVNYHALEAKEKADKSIEEIQAMREVVAINTTNWREDSRKIIVKIAHRLGGNSYIHDVQTEVYSLMRTRLRCKLDVQLTNMRRRMAEEGVCKSKREKMNYLDVIERDNRLKEGYLAIVKELAIKYGVGGR
ncbi:TPA: ORF6N domain-containing protein [Clostridium perfringens]|uniref:ORF6N domain-containing protein n=1 Tax=Clostridium perfringens TaxID=1502 RepID=UPI001B833867|nr:ORF6N domain-containing protein [Clostridium perfringens]MDH2475932.1 ORF6N domain-containing protein [Clostridium perfringens]HBC2028635.1 ORF6N domain-containing protein [Clostridium perfringens]HBC2031966.1 ORF6N domain-containing protein [Clostridium perfringens]HBC2055701.1 ORF6N domain-containing protein [Clostridium perfringens]HBC2069317.1 ORF6N domain-containing protein [Clostridium perfringens]